MEDLTPDEIVLWFSSNQDDLVEVFTMYDRASAARFAARDQGHAQKRWAVVVGILKAWHPTKSFVCARLESYIEEVTSRTGQAAPSAAGAQSDRRRPSTIAAVVAGDSDAAEAAGPDRWIRRGHMGRAGLDGRRRRRHRELDSSALKLDGRADPNCRADSDVDGCWQ